MALCWYLIVPASPAAAADSLELQEQEIKAGMLYNFLKYTDWPPASFAGSQDMVVCIFGSDPFGGALAPMAGRTVKQRSISIRRIGGENNVAGCHLLVIDSSESGRWSGLREALAEKHILTVSDMNGFTNAGGMIEFGRKDNRIRVNLNMAATTAAGLFVQDRLLKLVTIVKGNAP